MNVQNDTSNLTDNGSVFGRAYEINSHTMGVVQAAIASGAVTADKVPDLIREVHKAFAESYAACGIEHSVEALASGTAIPVAEDEAILEVEAATAAEEATDENVVVAEEELKVEERAPLVSLYENPYDAVTDERIHCLIDGVGKKMLKRYIRAHYNLEWEDYLRIFDLPSDYPSVAPKYSKSKSVEAKTLGLGSTVPKTPKALRLADAQPLTPRSTSERRRRQRDPQKSGRIDATQSKVA